MYSSIFRRNIKFLWICFQILFWIFCFCEYIWHLFSSFFNYKLVQKISPLFSIACVLFSIPFEPVSIRDLVIKLSIISIIHIDINFLACFSYRILSFYYLFFKNCFHLCSLIKRMLRFICIITFYHIIMLKFFIKCYRIGVRQNPTNYRTINWWFIF